MQDLRGYNTNRCSGVLKFCVASNTSNNQIVKFKVLIKYISRIILMLMVILVLCRCQERKAQQWQDDIYLLHSVFCSFKLIILKSAIYENRTNGGARVESWRLARWIIRPKSLHQVIMSRLTGAETISTSARV